MAIKLIIQTDSGEALPEPSQVMVREQQGQPITFTLTYAEDICEGDFQLINNPAFNPLKGIGIYVQTDEKTICLVQGFVQGQQITIKHGGQGSRLQVSGSDNSVKLSWETKTKAWEGEKWGKTLDKGNIEAIFKNNQHTFEYFSILENAANISFDDKVVQREDDLAFLKHLAQQSGMYVWVSYGEPGLIDGKYKADEIAHFDELPLGATPEITLVINGEDNNIDEFTISWDADRPTSSESHQINRRNKEKKDGKTEEAPQTKLGDVSLKQLTNGVISTLLPGPANDDGVLTNRNKAALNDAEWFIQASCSTTYERLCKSQNKIVHAHTLVEVQDAGSRHNGKYLVSGVTHTIDGESYKMQLELKRNAWNESI